MKFIIYALFAVVSLQTLAAQDVDTLARYIQDHLILEDYQAAKSLAQYSLKKYPLSTQLHEAYIRSLALMGEEKEMIQAWEAYLILFPEKANNRPLIEEMCWGVLNKATGSSFLPTRLISLLAGFFSQDTRGTEMLLQGMQDPNAAIRAVSVELSSHLRDAKLKDGIKRLFKVDQNWIVRQNVLKAIGSMKIRELKPELKSLIESDQALAEEKALAIESLVALWDEVGRDEIQQLAQSNRAGLRLLACQVIAHFQNNRDLDLLLKLAQDHNASVRVASLQAIGLLHPEGERATEAISLARSQLRDSHRKVWVSAAWLITLYSPEEGQQVFEWLLTNGSRDEKIWAAAALSSTGKYGAPLARRYVEYHPEPYVKLNLALGLICERNQKAIEVLAQGVKLEKEKWSWAEEGLFQALVPRLMVKNESPSTTPEMENQAVRLEILNTLAMVNYPDALDLIRQFLQERNWGITGAASALLLTEGDEASIEIVNKLLQDPNRNVRVQAALILSLWSREEGVIQILEQGYPTADKELKAKILEGIGRVGSMKSVPFLLNILKEPSQYLRIIAATMLIQCLNH